MVSTDPVNGRTLRPLMPRPFSTAFSTMPTHYASPQSPKLTPWMQPLSDYGGKREMNPLVSSRWNPTPEQVQALEEMYRRGTRTPSAEQIQQIAAKLRRFGKIEGKNVFYWFQNHKARDRQKKRRQLELLPGKNQTPHPKQSGLSRKYMEIDRLPKKEPTMTKCSTDSKYQLELQQHRDNRTAETSCIIPLDLSPCMSQKVSMQKTTDQKAPGQENAYPFVAHYLNKLLALKNDEFGEIESGIKENRTLELFPVRSSGLSSSTLICSTKEEMNDVGTKLVPNQFFEFLPTKTDHNCA